MIDIEVLNRIAKPTTERNIISLCLKNPQIIIDLKDKEISANMFLIEANRYIYMAIDYLFYKQQEPTPYAIMEVLKDNHAKSAVEEFGGAEYLEVLRNSRISENNTEIFCEKLKQAYTRYELYNVCSETQETLLSDKTEILNPSEILNLHETKLSDLNTTVQQTTEVYKMGTDAEEILAERAEMPNSIPGLEIGWNMFDYYTNGGQGGDLIMLCARPKVGKSTTLTNWATKLSVIDKLPCIYFDTEMNKREQEDRILSILSGIPCKEVVSGMYVVDTENGKAAEKTEKLKKAVEMLREGNYYHIYMPNFTLEKISAITKKLKLQKDLKAVFMDYIKFPASQMNMLKTAAEWQMLGYIASGMKDLAGILDVPVYAGCQESRTGDVAGSDRILQLASKLIFLSNKSDEDIIKERGLNGNQTLYIAYQRNGMSDCPPINIQFDKQILTQREI